MDRSSIAVALSFTPSPSAPWQHAFTFFRSALGFGFTVVRPGARAVSFFFRRAARVIFHRSARDRLGADTLVSPFGSTRSFRSALGLDSIGPGIGGFLEGGPPAAALRTRARSSIDNVPP